MSNKGNNDQWNKSQRHKMRGEPLITHEGEIYVKFSLFKKTKSETVT